MPPLALVLLLGGLILVSFQGALWYGQHHERAERLAASALLSTTLDTVTHQLALVGQQVQPITQVFQAILVKELTHFHTPTVDLLLAKLGPPFTLTEEEEVQLLEALKRREQDMGDQMTESEREAAHILPAVIKRVKREQDSASAMLTLFQTVSIPASLSREEKTP
jgi:hypothetical protein